MSNKDKFDIIKLIEKNSITRLNKDYENKLVNKIKNNFTNKDQQIFLTSFYCYLKYDSTKDFVIDFDTVWKWLGFTRKDNAKRVLEKNFTIDTDYKIKAAPQVGGAAFDTEYQANNFAPPINGKNIGGAGQNKEQIMLTVNTFKKFCLKSNTKKADEIHDYYIKLETILQETVNEQTNELILQLTNKEEENKKLEEEKNKIEEENVSLKKKIFKRQIHKYTEGSSVYIVMNEDKKNQFKFGETKVINNRLAQLNSTDVNSHYVHKIWYTRMAKKTEKIVHDIFDKYRLVKDRELFDIEILDSVIEFVDKLLNLYEEYDTVKVIKKEETVLYPNIVFIDENPKQCTKCLLYKKATDFHVRDPDLEEPKIFNSEEEKTSFYLKKYRSHCKQCNHKTNNEHKKLLRHNPTAGKKVCKECEELLDYKCFFDDNDECINCYKHMNNITEYCKQCNKCKNILFSKDFHSDSNKNDGLHTICKKCRNESLFGTRKSDDIECEHCKKIIKGVHNLKNHQKTKKCLKFQSNTTKF